MTGDDEGCAAGAHRLVTRVVFIEYGTVALTILTLMVSAYAFAGQIILDRQKMIAADYQAITHDRVELVKEIQSTGYVIPIDLMSQSAPCSRGGASDALVREASLAPPSTPPVVAADRSYTARLQLCAFYWRLKRANEDIVGANLHLVSWTQVALRLPPMPFVFGLHRPFISASAGVHDEWCDRLQFAPGADGHCGAALEDLIYRTREVAESLLGSIALYILPTLYGCLGAAAATLRTLRRKVELSLVSMTDRGRVQQDIILGLLCGAIIGLFAGFIGKDTSAAGLGLSALALLAGYNASGMFAFLDQLSNRLFSPTHATSEQASPS